MKNIVLFAISCLALNSFSQETNTWRIGIQLGFQGNHATYSGGMSNANARFNQNEFGGNALNLAARYDLDKHWMGTFGLGFNNFGFDYSLSENYSLFHPKNRFSSIKTEFGALEIPLMIYYKFNPNCKNAKWLVGGGFSENFFGPKTATKNFQTANDGATNSNYLTCVSSTNGGAYTMLRFSIAREKIFKRGNILNLSFILNAGFKQLAKSTVNYTVDGQTYTHEFTNTGNYVGFKLSYFLRPIKSFASANKPAKTIN